MTLAATASTLDAPARAARFPQVRLALRFALRDLRGGLSGFGIFIACIAVGVAAITGVAAVARGLSDGLAREGRTILGADLAFTLIHREATDAERQWLASRGSVDTAALIRAMARAPTGDALLVEAKAVDTEYPRHGALTTAPEGDIDALLALRNGVYGAVADPVLFARLGLRPGARVTIGALPIELRAELTTEPDKLAGGIGFGPRLILSLDALKATGLLQPGTLVRWSYRLTLPAADADDRRLDVLAREARIRFPDAGWEVRNRTNASPQFSRNLERFTQFLTLVGLTALVVGGVGVANATRAFVDRKRLVLATMKSLGATGGFVFAMALAEVTLLALIGIGVGLVGGALLPFALAWTVGSLLPFPLSPSIYPGELAIGVLYGLLTAFAFAIWPLGKAHDVPVSALFRDAGDDGGMPRRGYVLAVALAVLGLAAVAILFAWDRRIALIYAASAAGAFVLLRLVATGIMALARRLPRPRRTEARLALVNIHRPGSLTPSVVLSLGLGLTLLVALALIDANIRQQLSRTLPDRAPSFFFVDIPNGDLGRFTEFVAARTGDARLEHVPMMRGRIVSLKGVAADQIKAGENVSWVLEGDRGITYAEALPPDSRIVNGEWWPKDYRGEPLVSFTREVADGLGLEVGDRIVVNVLGRNVTARIANTRTVEWQTLGINFVMIFSPNAFAGAPHMHLATLTFRDRTDLPRELAVSREVALEFPAISTVRVKDALEAINEVVGQLAAALRGASGVALVSSVLVLAGALAAGHRNRIADAVVLKTLGATRPRLLLAFVLEYGALGLVTAVFGLLAGWLAAYVIVSEIMKLSFTMDWASSAILVVLSLLMTILLGLAGTWRILGQKPAPYLRDL